MREILFRGKRIHNGEWVDGSPVFYGEKVIMIEPKLCIKEVPSFGWVQGEVIPETVGQFTGLCDKNGKKVFEGDIIEMSFNGGQVELRAQVKYSVTEGYYFLSGIAKDKGWKGNYGYANPLFVFEKILNLEIIGNIHDNPELLEESKNE